LGTHGQTATLPAATETVLRTDSNPLYSTETLQRMYHCMLECRAFAKKAAARRSTRGMRSASCAPVAGREAIEVAAAVHTRPEDTIVAATDWLSGNFTNTPLLKVMAEASSGTDRTSPDVIAARDLSVAAVALATGIAANCKLRGSSEIVLLFADARLLHPQTAVQALEYAGAQKLPIIYIVERNLYSRTRKPAKTPDLQVTAARCGFPAIPVDGADALAVYRVVQEATVRARRRGSPTIVECLHSFAPSVIGGRQSATRTTKNLRDADPISRMHSYLEKKNILPAIAT
jgi:pyruvate dehydrogenase E1 component subunit alpha